VLSESEHVCGDDVDAELNPIKQMPVVVSGDHGAVYIGTIDNLEEENAGGGGVVPGTNVSIRNQLLGVQSALLLAMQQENFELKTSLTAMKVYLERVLRWLMETKGELHCNRHGGLQHRLWWFMAEERLIWVQ
jgi:hypothetical protein